MIEEKKNEALRVTNLYTLSASFKICDTCNILRHKKPNSRKKYAKALETSTQRDNRNVIDGKSIWNLVVILR